MHESGTFRILSLDGGGTRGIYTAHLLAQMEQHFGAPIRTCFDLIIGTSTGSIIAGAAVSDIPMADIVALFETEAPTIFRKRGYRIPLFVSKYPSRALATALAKHIPATPLGDITTPLMITSTELTKSEPHIFRSGYAVPTGDAVDLREAILASCAAPTFFAPKAIGQVLLADGGLWANNPSTLALTEAFTTFQQAAASVRMLSVGTGHSVEMYRHRRGWGVLTGWGGAKFLSYVLTLQSQAAAHTTQLLLNANYLRINPEIRCWELDTLTELESLKTRAAHDFRREAPGIRTLLAIDGGGP